MKRCLRRDAVRGVLPGEILTDHYRQMAALSFAHVADQADRPAWQPCRDICYGAGNREAP